MWHSNIWNSFKEKLFSQWNFLFHKRWDMRQLQLESLGMNTYSRKQWPIYVCISVWRELSPKFNTRGIFYGKFPHTHARTHADAHTLSDKHFAMCRSASIWKSRCKRQKRNENRNFPFVCRTRQTMDALQSQYPRSLIALTCLFALLISRLATKTHTHVYINTYLHIYAHSLT